MDDLTDGAAAAEIVQVISECRLLGARSESSLLLPQHIDDPIRTEHANGRSGTPIVYPHSARARTRRSGSSNSTMIAPTAVDSPAVRRTNRLLAGLSPEALSGLRDYLTPIALPLGTAIYEAEAPIKSLYFLTEGIVSLLQMTKDGSTAEVAVVGNEGVVGISMFMGRNMTPWRTVVRSPARALRLKAEVLARESARGGELQNLLLRYTQTLITQISQSAVCNRLHSVEQQFCRWLLASLDRLDSGELVMTQELLANMLGVRRERVTVAAGRLQQAGLIRYSRGRIVVVNRPRIEQRACECYVAVKREYDSLLSARESSRTPLASGPARPTRSFAITMSIEKLELSAGNLPTPLTDQGPATGKCAVVSVGKPRRRVAVIMQSRAIDSRWQSEVWEPVGVVSDYAGEGEPRVIVEEPGTTQWLYPGFDIVLQRAEAEGISTTCRPPHQTYSSCGARTTGGRCPTT